MKEFCGFRLDEVNQCIGDDPRPPASVILVDRDWALPELQRKIVLVTGEPGIGKTPLLDDFQWRSSAVLQALGNPGRDLPH
jgi:hypothetical protein